MSVFKTPTGNIKKKGSHMKGYPPEKPDIGQVTHISGNPSAKNDFNIKKPK